jgi:cytosine/creatinine deaminase
VRLRCHPRASGSLHAADPDYDLRHVVECRSALAVAEFVWSTPRLEGSPVTADPSGPRPGSDASYLELAVAAARKGLAEGGVPIGAALIGADGSVLATGYNKRVQLGSAIRHGETDALENAGRLPASVYAGSTMVTTLSPCDMCTGAILLYKIPRVVVGENRTFYGGEDLLRARGVDVVVLDDAGCVDLMTAFIADSPGLWNEDIGEQG